MNIVNKYRGIHNSEWVYGYYAVIGIRSVIIKLKPENFYSVDDNLSKRNGNEIVDVKADTVGQYIGVPDKNGKEIYEGDIVKDESIGLLGVVKFSERYLQFVVDDIRDGEQDYSEFMNKVEVIGNVYENADLLEEVGNEQIYFSD